ncbi:MAG: hypothetical protein U0234_31585 [Sandaracinus sp.]
MSEAEPREPPSKKRDEETSPFPLERERSSAGTESAPALPDESGIAPRRAVPESESTGERTGPFLLEREKPISEPPPPAAADASEKAPKGKYASRLTQDARRARRRIAWTLTLHTTLLATLGTVSIVRWTKGTASVPELMLAVLWIGVALIHARASWRFTRLGRTSARDARLLSGALADLRTVIVLKAVTLFLALTLLCFSLSMIISLVVSF